MMKNKETTTNMDQKSQENLFLCTIHKKNSLFMYCPKIKI